MSKLSSMLRDAGVLPKRRAISEKQVTSTVEEPAVAVPKPPEVNPEGFPPGHYYSAHVDMTAIGDDATSYPHDGVEHWRHIDLREAEQLAFFSRAVRECPLLPYTPEKNSNFRYHSVNWFFPTADAFTLQAMMRIHRPKRIIEVGSGFSSAVMLDTREHFPMDVELTFIEPYAERLRSILTPQDHRSVTIIEKGVQEVDRKIYDQLQAGDILFIDSSHVAKVGSDVSFLYLQILQSLKPGVLVHVHDVFYPYSYPMEWLRQGWNWNESLFLRAFLIGNDSFQVLAFNSFAWMKFPEILREAMPNISGGYGGSIWLRKAK